MMKYKIVRVTPHVFAVVVPNDQSRSNLFVRAQEFYENSSSKIRGKKFDVHKFLSDYEKKHHNKYSDDWSGFNIPLKTVLKSYKNVPLNYLTRYDKIMMNILDSITSKLTKEQVNNSYVIGVDKIGTALMLHELYHALYYTDERYKRMMNNALLNLPENVYNQLGINLRAMGYRNNKNVMHDEMQAYLVGADWTFKMLRKGIRKADLKKVHEYLKMVFSYYWTHHARK